MKSRSCYGVITEVNPGKGLVRILVVYGELRVGHEIRYEQPTGTPPTVKTRQCTAQGIYIDGSVVEKLGVGEAGEVQFSSFGTDLPILGTKVKWALEIPAPDSVCASGAEAISPRCFRADNDGAV